MKKEDIMSWFNPSDTTRPVFTADEHIRGKNLPGIWEALPDRAVVFFLGKGFPVVEEAFPTEEVLASLPGFITHSRVLRVTGHEDVCFVHGGYGAPQAVCTAEALIALGVKEFLLVGLCGAFGEDLAVGDVLLPPQILSEEGTSRHYFENPEFCTVESPFPIETLAAYLQAQSFTVRQQNTVTTDAPYRQTYHKEALWREMGCAAVDMEASAFVNLCHESGKKCAVALMVSDRHPLYEGAPPWQWGNESFAELQRRFITSCTAFALAK